MITAITFQWMQNVKYHNESLSHDHAHGDRFIPDLITMLAENVDHFTILHKIVSELGDGTGESWITRTIQAHGGSLPVITHKTKKKRTYYWGGLTIHEEDI